MAELPSGTVTFLFTDIEGSTALLKQLGESYGDVLADHQRLLREAFAAHGGHEIDTAGDSFFIAFRRAKDGVAAAAEAQRALAAHEWPEGVLVKVRMGLHSGEPVVGEERYVGLGVHRAARIGAIGHGGQVLLSSAARELVEDDLPPGVSLRDLGTVRLKDIDRPERVSQLVIEGLPSDFSRLKTYEQPPFYRRRGLLAGALAGVIAAAVAIPIFALGQGGSGGGLTVEGNAVAEIDPGSNKVVGSVPNVGARPSSIAYGSGSLWVANLDDQTVTRIDPATRTISKTLPVVDTPTGLATSPGVVWVVGANPTRPSVTVRRINPQFNTVSQKTRIANVVPGGPGSVGTRGNTVWAAPSSGLLSRLEPQTSKVVQKVDPNAGPTGVAVGPDAVWITDNGANTVTRVDPTGLLTPIAVGQGPAGIAVGAGVVWVANALDDTVVRIDPTTRAVTTTVPVGKVPAGIAVGENAVWVANRGDGTVTRIDPSNPAATKTIPVGGSPQAIAIGDGRVWVTVDTQTLPTGAVASSGGVARLNSKFDVDSMDTALSFSPTTWQLLYASCATLVNYPDKPAPAGSRLEPEIAQFLPTRSADGKTYTFTIRKGFRFSPPSDEPVTAQTFKYTIERSLSPKLKSQAQGFLGDVVGARPYMAGKASHIAGITVRGNRLTIRLVAPAPDLVTRLAMPFFCAVPIGTPLDPKGLRTIPSAGPYYVASYTPGQGAVLKRNPNYGGSRPHRLDRIELTVNVSPKRTDAEIEAGRIDYAQDEPDPSDYRRLATRYGAGSPAARSGRQQYFVNPLMHVGFLVLNTYRPLFHDVRVRRAVNYAIDRTALARIGDAYSGAPEQPTDQYLPPSMPGFKDEHIYPFKPDVATARRLLGPGARTAALYTCNQPPCDRLAQVVKTNLAAIGIQVQVKAFPINAMVARMGRAGEPFDISFGGWIEDYPDPFDFLNYLLVSGAGGFTTPFDDPAYGRKAAAAARLAGPRRYLAYGALDADVARNDAPWVAIGNQPSHDFFSARMGCQVFNPVYSIDLAALCIRKKS